MTLQLLSAAIAGRHAVLGVVGLGYVGLAVSCALAKAGFRVMGVDRDAGRTASIARGVNPLIGEEPGLPELLQDVVTTGHLTASTDPSVLAAADIVLIAVETPVDLEHRPNVSALTSACESVASHAKPGVLVIVESTIAPGTMNSIVRPVFERVTGGRVNAAFLLGHCPERVMPGRLLTNLASVPRVCGGYDAETAAVMVAFYGTIVRAHLEPSDCLTAELVKTAENAYRDVNIALANELALICESLGGNVWKVRELVNQSPGRAMLRPGAGVGGHCIPKDPWLLIANVGHNYKPLVVPAARAVNDSMPKAVVQLVLAALDRAGRAADGAQVTVLGYSYLENTGDVRNTPALAIVEALRRTGANVRIHDPFVPDFAMPLHDQLRGSDCIVLVTAHAEYDQVNWAEVHGLMRRHVVVDSRNALDAAKLRSLGFDYVLLGDASERRPNATTESATT